MLRKNLGACWSGRTAKHGGARGRLPSADAARRNTCRRRSDTGGWYLRGDVGVGSRHFNDFAHHQTNSAFVWPASWRIDQKDIADTAFVGFGVGYAWNNWLRFDVTGEYRAEAKVQGDRQLHRVLPGRPLLRRLRRQSFGWVFLANAYIDLGTWWCLTPFIGAGVGWRRYTSQRLHRCRLSSPTAAPASASPRREFSKWNMAWAVHAGLAYNVTNNFKVEFAYRYLNMGTLDTADHRLRVRLAAPATGRAPSTPSPTSTRRTSSSACAGCCSRTSPVYRSAAADAPRLIVATKRLRTARDSPAPFCFWAASAEVHRGGELTAH